MSGQVGIYTQESSSMGLLMASVKGPTRTVNMLENLPMGCDMELEFALGMGENATSAHGSGTSNKDKEYTLTQTNVNIEVSLSTIVRMDLAHSLGQVVTKLMGRLKMAKSTDRLFWKEPMDQNIHSSGRTTNW